MNPLQRFRNYFIGEALAQTDDVFEQAKITLLFSFTTFFLLFSTAYIFLSLDEPPFTTVLAVLGTLALIATLIVLRKTKNVTLAASIYIANQTVQNFCHFIFTNAQVEMQGVCWLLLYVIFAFLMLGRKWGLGLAAVVTLMISAGIVNQQSGYAYFNFPPWLRNANDVPEAVMMPILLIVFLTSQFVKARQKAEEQIRLQKILVEKSNNQLELQRHDMISSINYAKRIQYAVLPNEDSIYRSIPLSFILYKPRDIVSGDFFWFHEMDRDNYILICADCTGHGVPGALMTVIGSNLLTQIITENKVTQPADILVELDNKITATLKQQKEHYQIVQDGMDLSLLKVDKQKKEFIYTSAKRPAIFIRDKTLNEFKGSKNTIGGLRSGEKKFNEVKMKYEEDDIIYLFTDGYIDQFGGTDNKKFMIKRFREILLNIHYLPMHEQKQKVEQTINNWIGKNEQTDDITVMGIRF